MTNVSNYILTFEAIDAVRRELHTAASSGNIAGVHDCLARLSTLYSSIDAKGFIAVMQSIETHDNVLPFKRAA